MRINFENTGSYKRLDNTVNNAPVEKQKNTANNGVIYSANEKNTTNLSEINSSYDKSGKTKEDIMNAAGNINLDAQSDFMTLMSNTMSNEDFQRMCEDGIEPSELTADETITVSDRIKAALLAGGTHIPGYTDDVSKDTLEALTGNEGLAAQIQEAFQENGAYLSVKNLKDTMNILELSEEITPISDDEMVYMVEEGLAATVNNIYLAQHSLGNNETAKPISEEEWQSLLPEVEKIFSQSDLEVNDNTLERARILLERNVAITKENLDEISNLKSIAMPIDRQIVINAAAMAVADGKTPIEGDLTKEKTNWQQAEELYFEIQNMPEPENLHNKRVLEETRLVMTIDANKKLIENNIAIDTNDLEKLVENLKEAEKETAKKLFPNQEETKAVESLKQWDGYQDTVNRIKLMPLSTVPIIADRLKENNLSAIEEQGSEQRKLYEQREQAYETFMTAPRADLGDRIATAFRNTDILLEDIGLENSEENQRAVRALGYNSMEISRENIELVKEADMTLQNIVNKMTPQSEKMIRDGVNTLKTTIDELDIYLTKQESTAEEEQKKYSEYLYNLEKNNAISYDEKEGYIGIYRLLRQIEKTDGAAIGSLINQGNEINFDNLLHAVRSRKARRTDLKIDDKVILKIKGIAENSIDSQINSSFLRQNVNYEKKKIEEDIEIIAKEIKEQGEESYQEYTRSIYRKEILENPVGEEMLSNILERLDESPTLENIYAISDFWKNSGKIYERVKELVTKYNQESLEEEARKLAGDTEETDPVVAYEDFLNAQREHLEKTLETKPDINAKEAQTIGLLYKQIGFAIKAVKENHYYFPVEIGDHISNVKLTLKKGSTGKETIEASMDTQTQGKISINLSVSNKKIGGVIVHEKAVSDDIINELGNSISEKLEAMGYECSRIYSASNEKMEVTPFEKDFASETKGEELQRTAVSRLFSIAKEMMKAVSQTLD